jgi:farnesyl-diphosphate farnesyltransferase
LFTQIAKAETDARAKKRRDEFMADLRSRGIIKNRTPEEQAIEDKRIEDQATKAAEEGTPYLMIGGIIFGIFALMGLMGLAIVWLVMTFVPQDH